MKKIPLLALLTVIILSSCQQADKRSGTLLSRNNLPTQVFSININKDTTIATANGAFISIPTGALSGNGNETVQLEIKEAYSMEQIIMAGLTTQSNGQALSSGGMIYISAAGGQSIKINKPLAVKIPTPSLNKNMQLFKGDTDENGRVNWVKPDSLPSTPQTLALDNGKWIFSNNCASCHAIGKDGAGPDLAYVLDRQPDKPLLYAFTRNNRKVLADGEPYYRCLYETRGETAMNLFSSLTDNDLDNLYGYIENESKLLNRSVSIVKPSLCFDSCRTYNKLKTVLSNKLNDKKVDMVIQEISNRQFSIDPVGSNKRVDTSSIAIPTVNKVIPVYNQSLFYQFKIEGFGWYNIDRLLSDADAVESNLTIQIAGKYTENINLYLIIPDSRILASAGLLDNGKDKYGFYETNGHIYLPQKTNAFILAVGEFEDKIISAQKEFITSADQHFEMSLSVVTNTDFNATIKNICIDPDLQISVSSINNADTLRKMIKDLKDVEKIKPKSCDCSCGFPVSDSSSKK